MQFILRFIVGGAIVSMFAALGDVLKPKSFAGLFGAAPSVALATLGLTIVTNGKLYAAQEAHSMIVGALALFFYCCATISLIMKQNFRAASAATLAIPIWLICTISIWLLILRQIR
jgi:Protein of unknown function (DUF3147)